MVKNKKTILVASDSFKGTLSSLEICRLFQNESANRDDINLLTMPLADGGEGSLEAISHVLNGQFIETNIKDLYLSRRNIKYFVYKDKAYIESANIVGMGLAKKDNNPGLVTTYGIGEQIKSIISRGIKDIYIFLGGSASNDGGVGLAAALGTKFYNEQSEEFLPTGLTLKDIVKIDNSKASKLLDGINITALSDVKSPFYGEEGAAYKFAAQKGASKDEIKLLDEGLRHLSDLIHRDLNIDISKIEGAGAAGGLGGGLYAFANAKIESGSSTILDLYNFDNVLEQVDLVITGEGKLDEQTSDGKLVSHILKRTEKRNKDVIIVVGTADISLLELQKYYKNVKKICEIGSKSRSFEENKASARDNYLRAIKEII